MDILTKWLVATCRSILQHHQVLFASQSECKDSSDGEITQDSSKRAYLLVQLPSFTPGSPRVELLASHLCLHQALWCERVMLNIIGTPASQQMNMLDLESEQKIQLIYYTFHSPLPGALAWCREVY